ncbi:MAG: tetraacyldisaccharide 4'-kinase [Chitinophagaceae bacterium]|nr:tetraacyldisaccharide 4'-kinase [Chitinophagaceae bacterium]
MLKSFRYILFPLSVVWGSVIWVRNKLYDKNILKSAFFNFPIICVGNLAVGGTGKTPMVEYLIRLLKDEYKVATLSRGYKRKTEGFAIADDASTALDIGDEPMQFHKKFPDVTVAVAEERLVSLPQLLHAKPETQVIILDDAFQHRQVRAGLNILLTDYKNLYTRDFILPAGDLRDVHNSSKRADIIIVTKCKSHLTIEEKNKIERELNPEEDQCLFFTKIEYSSPYHLFNKQEKFLDPEAHILLVCGIANPKPLQEVLNTYSSTYDMIRFGDHHIFNTDDLNEIKKQFSRIGQENKIILTTEKDGVRLAKFENELKDLPVYVIPIRHKFLFAEESKFEILIKEYIRFYKRDSPIQE